MKMQIIILASIASLAIAVPVKRGVFDSISQFPFLASAHGSSSSSSKDSKEHDHKHDHEHDHKHDHEHDHEHDYKHDHEHDHEHDYKHDHEHDYKHDHEHDHVHDHQHDHGLDHYHDHEHDFHDSLPNFDSVSHTSHLIHHPESYPVKGHHDDLFHNSDHFVHDDVSISYQNQYFGHNDIATSYQNQYLYDDDGQHDSLLDNSNLDAPEYLHDYGGDYKNYGGDLGQYSQHAGLLDISDDHSSDHLLEPYSPSHSSYDSY